VTRTNWNCGSWDEGVRWRTNRIVDPVDLPVELDYLYQVLGITDTDNAYDHIKTLAWQATEAAEDATSRALMTQTIELVLDRFPRSYIEIPNPPLQEILSVEYVDGEGATQTLAGSPAEYLLSTSGRYAKARIAPLYGAVWPTTRCQEDAVTITYTAGYESADAVPHLIKAGIALMVGELYKNRELSITGSTNNINSVLQLDRFWKRVY